MRTWDRARIMLSCGRCGNELQKGDPIQLIRLAAIGATKIRGVCCAEGTPPADLPELVDRVPLDATPLSRLLVHLPLDWKARGAGDREPGEDG